MSLGQKIYELRTAKNLSQDELAETLGISRQSVSKWETDIATPDFDNMLKLCDVFCVTLDELAERETNQPPKITDANRLLSFDFTKKQNIKDSGWKIERADCIGTGGALSIKSVPCEEVRCVHVDPMIINNNVCFDARVVNYIHIRLKADIAKCNCCYVQIYFKTDSSPIYSQDKVLWKNYVPGSMCDLHICTCHPEWKGKITGVRIDPVEHTAGNIEIQLFELLYDVGAASLSSWDFTKYDFLKEKDWTYHGIESIDTSNSLSFKIQIKGVDKEICHDPNIVKENLNLDLSNAKYIHVVFTPKCKLSKYSEFMVNGILYNYHARIYFTTADSPEWTQDKSLPVGYNYATGKELDLYIRADHHRFWNGTLTGLRFDPVEGVDGSFDIKLIEILDAAPVDKLNGMLSNLINQTIPPIYDRISRVESVCRELMRRIENIE